MIYLTHPPHFMVEESPVQALFKEEPVQATGHMKPEHKTLSASPIKMDLPVQNSTDDIESKGFIYNDPERGFSRICFFPPYLIAWAGLHKQKINILGAECELSLQICSLGSK